VPVPVAPAPASLPCAACAALLSVPAGLARFACPLCGVELTVDGGHLRAYLASPPRATVSVLAPPPAGITLSSRPSPHRRPEGQVEKYNHLTRTIHREETFSSSKTGTIHTMLAQKEPSIYSAHREEYGESTTRASHTCKLCLLGTSLFFQLSSSCTRTATCRGLHKSWTTDKQTSNCAKYHPARNNRGPKSSQLC